MANVNNYTAAGDQAGVTETFVLNGLDPDLYYQDRVSIDADRTVPNRCGQIFPQNTPLFDV
jgi:hypothetical protein